MVIFNFRCIQVFLCLFTCISYVISEEFQKLNFVNEINSAQDSWVAEENEWLDKSDEELRMLMGFRKKPAERGIVEEKGESLVIANAIPESFDARIYWPKCASIASIKDQSNCGSCWAVSTAAAFSDRLCIGSDFKIHVNLSAEALMTCCTACTDGDPGCEGGYLDEAWKYCKWHGLVTGGDYGSKEGCQPYGIAPCRQCGEAETPKCDKKKCTNKKYHKKYKKDLHKGRHYYQLDMNVTSIKSEILKYGPVVAGFRVFRDFMTYKEGVYHHVSGNYLGGHAVRIIGWGKHNGTPYWLVANSWNRTWGENGCFKILQGKNECDIEANMYAGTVIPK